LGSDLSYNSDRKEPVAIPYKFIKICPKNDKNFIVENAEELSVCRESRIPVRVNPVQKCGFVRL